MKHCCVIGGCGFIGTHIVDTLLTLDRKITVIDKNPLPSKVLPKEVRYITGDFGDKNLLFEILKDVNEVIHLAYSTVSKSSFENPISDIIDNLPATVRLFEVASNLGIEKLVLVSSGGTVYGKVNEVPIKEDHPTNPISPYGITKLTCEKYANMFYNLRGLPVVCVRPGNAYGEGQKPFTGQGFIATAIASILKGKEIVLYGETGTIRDYIYVTDLANGIIAAMNYCIPGSCYNIGSGVGRSNKDILDIIYPFAESAGLEPRVKILPLRQFDVPVNVLDSTKIIKETGWEKIISLKDGIEKTWKQLYF